MVHVGVSLLVYKTGLIVTRVYATKPSSSNSNSSDDNHIISAAAIAALLFAVQPVHCDAVASVVGRADLLCTLFSLLAFWSYACATRDVHKTRWIAFVVALALNAIGK